MSLLDYRASSHAFFFRVRGRRNLQNPDGLAHVNNLLADCNKTFANLRL